MENLQERNIGKSKRNDVMKECNTKESRQLSNMNEFTLFPLGVIEILHLGVT
jgi:hypothetical protein